MILLHCRTHDTQTNDEFMPVYLHGGQLFKNTMLEKLGANKSCEKLPSNYSFISTDVL